ncbi:MAG TPA: response regulator [Burkholderiales bacterium]|nr:response regulator [Burkholderiales bacterium]
MGRPDTRVLVIDDHPDIRDSLRWLLEGEGYTVCVAANGLEGLRLQRKEPSDIVVTDIFMPEQDGIETLWKFREEFPSVPIIVMSGGGPARGTDYLAVARELGAKKALKKPLDPQELIDVVGEITRSRSS